MVLRLLVGDCVGVVLGVGLEVGVTVGDDDGEPVGLDVGVYVQRYGPRGFCSWAVALSTGLRVEKGAQPPLHEGHSSRRTNHLMRTRAVLQRFRGADYPVGLDVGVHVRVHPTSSGTRRTQQRCPPQRTLRRPSLQKKKPILMWAHGLPQRRLVLIPVPLKNSAWQIPVCYEGPGRRVNASVLDTSGPSAELTWSRYSHAGLSVRRGMCRGVGCQYLWYSKQPSCSTRYRCPQTPTKTARPSRRTDRGTTSQTCACRTWAVAWGFWTEAQSPCGCPPACRRKAKGGLSSEVWPKPKTEANRGKVEGE